MAKLAEVKTLTSKSVRDTATPTPWSCNHHKDGSDIEAYCEATGDWEIVAQTRAAPYVNAKANASYIAHAVNDYERMIATIYELVGALELCLESEDLSWEAEQEAEIVCARAHQAL